MSDSESYADSQENSDVEASKSGFPFTQEALGIPFRMQQVLLNWVFIVASAALILDFGALQEIYIDHTHQFAELCNWFGVLSCFCWLLGFSLLAHWLHMVGGTTMGLVGCYLKLVAAIFFNLQPMTGTMNDALLGGPAGTWWSNLTGIILFHIGNLVSCYDFYVNTPPGADKKKGWLYHGNLPVTGMWIYQAATWFLVASNAMACSFDGASWAPLVPVPQPPVFICQFAGGFLLLFGAIMYTVWCDGFRNFRYDAVA